MRTIKFFAYSLMITSGMILTSCGSDDSDGGGRPPIGGYDNADQVGADDLVAYFPLDGNGKEDVSGAMPSSSTNVTWVDGVKGKAAKLSAGYLDYEPMANLSTSMPSMTISLWAKVNNNGGPDAVNPHATMLFQLSKPGDWAGNINVMSETSWYAPGVDTLVVKGYVKIKMPDGAENGQDSRNSPKPSPDDIEAGHVGNANKNAGKWAHYVITWDATNGFFRVYANGQKISNPMWESRNGGEALGLNFFTPTRPIIGTFASVIAGGADAWQKSMDGEIDEIRVYKKVLIQQDIAALYQLELAGR
ncbi:LamG-like jellyroll fold domain-containing protein [Flavobacterium sp. MK4S-17]|uniref:LamG-like jellyroll fold domain-containing protein n=1 Tax=Flavobacterium sp. MK4S-17 TaxID=2543737 RepID=UPI00135B88BD|nr:LamG-like jellyroll fold domain-containing protein [Flavobacterium sp. MK4S-17]